MKISRFLMVSVLTAWVLSPALSAASIPAVVPAPQRTKVSGGTYSVKAKRIDGSLYSFRDDSSLNRMRTHRRRLIKMGVNCAPLR